MEAFLCHSESTIFYDEFLALLIYLPLSIQYWICLSFVESYRRGLSNILCPCGRRLDGNVTPKCAGRNKSNEVENFQRRKLSTEFQERKSYNETFDIVL